MARLLFILRNTVIFFITLCDLFWQSFSYRAHSKHCIVITSDCTLVTFS